MFHLIRFYRAVACNDFKNNFENPFIALIALCVSFITVVFYRESLWFVIQIIPYSQHCALHLFSNMKLFPYVASLGPISCHILNFVFYLQNNIHIVEEWIANEISSTKIRYVKELIVVTRTN